MPILEIKILFSILIVSLFGSVCYGMNGNIFDAARDGHIEQVSHLIDAGADVNQQDQFGWTPLHRAAHNGHLAVIQLLIDRGAKINQQDDDGRTLLLTATLNNQLTVVQLLIDKGANVNLQNKNGSTALHRTAYTGNKIIAQLLIDRQVEVNQEDFDGYTPLHSAAQHNNQSVAQLLIENGAMLDRQNHLGQTPFDIAMQNGHQSIITLIEYYTRRIQPVKRRIREGIIPRALAMATHDRLGSNSPITMLPQILLKHISKLTQEAEIIDARQSEIAAMTLTEQSITYVSPRQDVVTDTATVTTSLIDNHRIATIAIATGIVLCTIFARMFRNT